MKSEMPLEQSGSNCRIVHDLMTPEKCRATDKLCSLLIHPGDYSAPAVETRRRIHILVKNLILDPAGKEMDFSAETLARLTAWFDAMPKSLGYLYLPTLEREAQILIPKPIRYPLDKTEFLNSVVNFHLNAQYLNCPQLVIGLYIMLFFSLQNFQMLEYGWGEFVDRITKPLGLGYGGGYGSGFRF